MSQTGVVSWSQTAASNATADSNVNWAEGMAPSQVNDSARAVMASVAKWRDDNTGVQGTLGGTTAYTYGSQQVFSALTVLHNQTIDVVFNATNAVNPTLNVDSLGAKPIVLTDAGGTGLPAGWLIINVPYQLTYDNNTNGGQFYVRNLSTQNWIPPGTMLILGSNMAPASNLGVLQCNGQAVSRTTFAALFSAISTTYGTGDGSTTFNLPNQTTSTIGGVTANLWIKT